MARAGLLALQFYNPATGSWGQAHMQARFALLRVMLEAGEGFVTLGGGAEALSAEAVTAGTVEEGERGVFVALDRGKIASVGLPAVSAFLKALQVVKSTADAQRGIALFKRYTDVPSEWLPLRALVVQKRKPRCVLHATHWQSASEQPRVLLLISYRQAYTPIPSPPQNRQSFVQPVLELAAEAGAAALQLGTVERSPVQDAVVLRTFPGTLAGAIDSFVYRFPEVDQAVLQLWREEAHFHRV
jgi:hypothetical protein